MTTSTVTPEIAAFAAAVRQALADLPADERDELTEGLEADLAEAYAEDLRRELPDPVEYAAELRTAAGLPEPSTRRRGVGDVWRTARRDLAGVVARHPALAQVADFLGAIRPVWWIARAWVAAWLLSAVFGSEGGFVPGYLWTWILLLGLVVVSVQWGRGRWSFRGLAPVVVIGNVVAALLVLPVVAMADDAGSYVEYVEGGGYAPGAGLSMGGTAVRNVFAFDAKGRPLTDVQLFDQDGRPLEVLLDPIADECYDAECRSGYRVEPDGTTYDVSPGRLTTGRSVLNVFPLALVPVQWDDLTGRNEPVGEAAVPPAPYDRVPAVDRLEGEQKVSPDND